MASYPPDLEAYVAQKVESGEFSSRDDFAVEAVRLYRELERRHAVLKADVTRAIDEARQGLAEPLDLEAIQEALRSQLDERGNPR